MVRPYVPELDFRASPTLWSFFESDAHERIVTGPFGSGKTTACIAEIYRRALMQAPNPSGWRMFKALVVRNTSIELRSTTIPTWQSIFPDHLVGSNFVHSAPMRHHIRVPPHGDEPGLDMLVEFIAMDRQDDRKKLLSAEYTLIYFNELQEIDRAVWDFATMRVGRYPSMVHGGVMPTWKGVIADTNEPDEDHWIYTLEAGAVDGDYVVFRQPPALLDVPASDPDPDGVIWDDQNRQRFMVNPGAENLPNLDPDYYRKGVRRKTVAWIQRFLQNKRVFVQEGKPCVPGFDDTMMSRDFQALAGVPLDFGYDVGGGTMQPAAVIMQRHHRGNHLFLAEVHAPDMGLKNFCNAVHSTLSQLFPDHRLGEGWADPAGRDRDEIYETSAIDYIRSRGLPCRPAPANDIKSRIESYRMSTERLIDGMPGLIVHKRCQLLRRGLSGGWHFRRVRVTGAEVYSEAPVKNVYSHPCDAGGYGLLGSGEHREISGRASNIGSRGGTVVAQTSFDPFAGIL